MPAAQHARTARHLFTQPPHTHTPGHTAHSTQACVSAARPTPITDTQNSRAMAAAAEAAVLNLITTHNRPFGVQGLVDNLQSAGIKKAAVAKAVDALTERGAITCKEFGKTKIYLPNQAGLEVMSKEELEAKRAEQKELQEALLAADKGAREAEAELRSWQSSMTVEQLRERVTALTASRDQQLAKLSQLRSGAALVAPEQRRAAEVAFRGAMEAWRKRRSVFRGIWDTISEGIDGKQADLFEEVGVDTDEAAGITYAQMEALLSGGGGAGGKAAAAAGMKRPRG